MNKKIFCVIFSLFMIFNFAFAENSASKSSEKENSESKSESETDQIWENTKSTAKSVGDFLKKKADQVDKKIKSNSKTACEGKWTFENGKAETTILCNSDGTMNIRMAKEDDVKLWKGSYESTKNEIIFHIIVYNERINGKEKFDSLTSDDWKISYKVENTEKMTLTSEDMSADFNGYKFVNPTVFLRVK